MDRERSQKTREVKRTAVVTSRLPHARRQQRVLSSAHLNNCSSAKEHNPTAVLGNDNGGGTAGEAAALVIGCKRNAKESKGSLSSEDCEMGSGGGSDGNEDGLRPPPTTVAATAACNRKRVKLIGKVSDDLPAVDPALVPRKLRSAINKRCGDSTSQILPSARKKLLHIYKGINLVDAVKDKLSDPLTKDEEDVVKTLFSLANLVVHTKPDQSGTDGRSSPKDADAKAVLPDIIPEASKGGAMKLSSQSTAMCSTSPSHIEELPVEALEGNSTREVTEANILKVSSSSVLLGSKKLYLELNGIAELENQESAKVMKNENSPNLSGAINSSYPVCVSSSACPAKRPSQPMIQLETLQSQKSENGLLPGEDASTTRKQETKFLNENIEKSIVFTYQEALEMKDTLTNSSTPVNSIGPFSTKTFVWPDSAGCITSPAPTRSNLLTKRSSWISSDSRQSWKKCATHAYIGHLIRNYQNTLKKNDSVLSSQQKVNEKTFLTNNESTRLKNSSSASGMHSCIVESNQPEVSVGTQNDRKLQEVQLVHTTSGIYSQQKQMYDFLPLSAGSGQARPGIRMESPGKLPVAYLHTLGPHHHMMPFSLPPGQYSSPYKDHLAAAASEQVLQLPHYLGNPFYGTHMGHAGGPTKHQLQQQQQMWQAHLNHYRASPILPQWQSQRQPDPSSSLPHRAQLQSGIPHSPIDNRGGSHHVTDHPPLPHQVLSIPLRASNRTK